MGRTGKAVGIWVWSFTLFASVLLAAFRADAQQARALVLVDAAGDPEVDARIAAELTATLGSAGYSVSSPAETTAAFQQAGGYGSGRAATDQVVLEQVRGTAGAAVLVRVSRASGGADWVGADIQVVSYLGRSSASSTASLAEAPQRFAGVLVPMLPPPPTAAPAPTAPAQVGPSSPQPSGPSGAPASGPRVQGAESAQSGSIDPQNRQASAQFQRDCAADPSQEICKQQGGLTAGAAGIQAGFSQETITRVKQPPKYSIDFAMDGSFTYGKMSFDFPAITPGQKPSTIESEFYGGGLALGVKILAGGTFPGPGGGSWSGLFIDPSVSVSGAGGQMTIPEFKGPGFTIPEYQQGYGMLLINGGLAAGYQWLYFGSMDPQSLKQGGFGINVGYRVGAVGSQVYFDGGSGDFTTSFSHGPVLGLTFPSYNAGTADLSRAYIQGMILPTGDLLLITIAAGFAF